MGLTPDAVGVITTDIQCVTINRGITIGIPMPLGRLRCNLSQTYTLDTGCGTGKITLNKIRRQAYGVKDLCTTIRLIG